jgi:hypothetical protein
MHQEMKRVFYNRYRILSIQDNRTRKRLQIANKKLPFISHFLELIYMFERLIFVHFFMSLYL